MSRLRVFLISVLAILAYQTAMGCAVATVERWYMFKLCQDEFADRFNKENEAYWRNYCQKGQKDWITDDDRTKAARRRGDTEMQLYLKYLNMYTGIVDKMHYDWEYPTAAELATRRSTLEKVADISASRRKISKGETAQRWCLLNMRANMLLKRYSDNIATWENVASHYSDGHLKDMMRNIYANALLNTGKKRQAWDIYASQNDQQSLLWSVRKYTNLAGIKQIYNEDPNAPVLTYLLQYYVNELQDVCDRYPNLKDFDPEWNDFNEAYAPLPKDIDREMTSFVTFAREVALGGKTDNPAMWMSAAALVNYFMGNYTTACNDIKKAESLPGTEAAKKMARRIKMLIMPEMADISKDSFKGFMANELRWLDNDIKTTDNIDAIHARDRILNLGLAKAYKKKGDMNTAMALLYLNHNNDMNTLSITEPWYTESDSNYTDVNQDHSSSAYEMLWALSPNRMVEYFNYERNAGDPLGKYIAECQKHSDDYINDLIGTKYLSIGDYTKALEYLDKVSLDYLSKQSIAPYAAVRSYKVPAWACFQTTNGELKAVVNRNIKADFCRDVLKLINEYKEAGDARKHEIEYEMAVYTYQASSSGQCWFITDYEWSSASGEWNGSKWVSKPKSDNMSKMAQKMLTLASNSNDKNLKAKVLFAYAGMNTDDLFDTKYYYGDLISTLNRNSESYPAYVTLDRYLRYNDVSVPEISRCDVLKQFRKLN